MGTPSAGEERLGLFLVQALCLADGLDHLEDRAPAILVHVTGTQGDARDVRVPQFGGQLEVGQLLFGCVLDKVSHGHAKELAQRSEDAEAGVLGLAGAQFPDVGGGDGLDKTTLILEFSNLFCIFSYVFK